MKNASRLFVVMFVLAMAAVSVADQVQLDVRGGQTYDFEALSKQRFHGIADGIKGENLISNANFADNSPGAENDPLRWMDSYYYIHNAEAHRNPEERERKRERMREIIRWEINDGVASIIKPAQLREVCGPLTKDASAAWSKVVELPNTDGGTYRLTFKYQARHETGGNNYMLVVFRGEHENPLRGKETAGARTFPFADVWGEWGLFTQEIVVPADTKYLYIIFRTDDVGELKFKDPVLAPVKKSEKLTIHLSPQGFLDSVFALSQNQPAIMTFVWKRNGTPAEAQLQNPRMRLRLPSQVKLKDITFGKIAGREEKAGIQEFDIEISPTFARRPAWSDGFDTYLVLPALLSSTEEPGEIAGAGSCVIEENGQAISNLETFTFKVIPTISVKAKAQKYLPGFYVGGRYLDFGQEECAQLAEFFGQVGVRWIIGSTDQDTLAAWRKHGVKVITPELYYIANGFRVGNPKDRPESDKFKYIGNASHSDLDMASCPIAIYERRPYFQENIRKYMADNLKGTDGLWANWEPYMFTGKGCFCDNCCAKFAEYVHVPLEQMKQEWPQELTRGKKYYEQSVRFRSLEHAKLVRTIHEEVCKLTGGEQSLGFIPGIAWIEMASCWRDIPNGKEVHQSDYAADLRWIDPWGPYPCWPTQSPYIYKKAHNLNSFVAARDVRNQVNQDYPPEKRPKLLAFPHGIQSLAWVTQPEAMELDLNSFFFNGFEAATLYIFPRGYDNRYWAAFARAAENAADYEDFVFDGKRIDQRIVLTPSAPYASPASKIEYLPNLDPVSMLQHLAYEKDGRIIVPVFNFWKKGNAFFTMQVEGLPQGDYQLSAQGVLFAPKPGFFKKKNYFSSAELAQGVQLFVGACRCQVFEISPGTAKSEPTGYNANDINKLRQQFLPELTVAAQADQEYEAKYGVKKSTLTEIDHVGITCRPQKNNEFLHFSSGNNQVLLNCKTMSVVDWQYNGKAQLAGEQNTALGTVAFWTPSLQINTPYLVTSQTKIDGGLLVSAEQKLTGHTATEMDGLLIRQHIEILDSCRKIRFKTELVNASSDELPCAFQVGLRYHCFPKALAEKDGVLQLNTQEGTLNFTRNFGRTIFSIGDDFYESIIRKTFGVTDPARKINGATAVFKSSSINNVYRPAPAADFVGYALWDGGSQLTSTFEPCFKLVSLPKAGNSARYEMEVTAE